ncbi:MAG TPA: histidine kinase [Clostridiales bacterium]|nr:histidine kinase [Clostridiales bacterium]
MWARLLNKFNHLKFDKKMKIYIFSNIVIATTIILAVSTISSVSISIKKSKKMAEEQLFSIATNYDDTFNNYKDLSVALILDSTIQNYLTYKGEKNNHQYQLEFLVKNTLSNAKNVYSNINFIGIINDFTADYIYKGDITLFALPFNKMYKEDYKNSLYSGVGALRISHNAIYFNENYSSISIYHPIYSTKKIGKELGLLCINFNDSNLKELLKRNNSYANSGINLIDSSGIILSTYDSTQTKSKIDYLDKLVNKSGSFTKDNMLHIYQKIGKWNYYLVYMIPTKELMSSSINVMVVLILFILIMGIFTLFTSKKLVEVAYKPLNDVILKMDNVSLGKLDVRMNEKNIGEDFAKLSIGFNSMMDQIILLMEKVKSEQHQLDQIRFNALQSQIKPHFLYNTLECIHWQAISEGNEEVSTLVKALAAYYKICLSEGKEIITLDQEIEHIRNYIIIQNMRYDNIVDSDIQVDFKFNNVKIPKITLQPLVENSIYHGLKVKEGKSGKIKLHVEQDENDIIIVLADTGLGMTQDEIDKMNNSISHYSADFGYGVRNANKRIELLFGEEYGLHYIKNKEDGITVKIRLPLDVEIRYEGVL